MVKISLNTNNVIVYDEKAYANVALINKAINKELKSRKDIYLNDETSRAIRRGNYIVINSHASLIGEELLTFISNLYKFLSPNYEVTVFDEAIIKSLSDLLPKISVIDGNSFGGTTPDTDTIEPGVLEIAEAINSIPDITTFASCNGHEGKRAMYVSFVAYTTEALKKYTGLMNGGLEKFYGQHKIVESVSIQNTFHWGDWPEGTSRFPWTGVYYNLMIHYTSIDTAEVYALMKDVADYIKENL